MKSSKGKGPMNGTSKPSKKLPPTTPGRQRREKQKETDPVEVYCRIRPLSGEELESCIQVESNGVLQITPPPTSLAFKSGHRNHTKHTFKHVFDEGNNQTQVFDRVAFPLVEDLLQGKNALMFAYGITNSGKTYTMNGEPEHAGVLPRSLDVIFNSITDVQAPKYVFRPDGANGFDVFSEEDANIENERNRPKKVSPRMRSEMPDYGDLLRIPEPRKVEQAVDEDSLYAVFVSYVEIYNNYVYDLLEEQSSDSIKRPLTSHILREDSSHNMYVSGATEVEVKSTEEAFDVLFRGQKQRRVACTQLNDESSRSHSVLTIRIVQAPLDYCGKEVLQDKSKVSVSQLSLVDLAGSERTSRTNSAGDTLKQAAHINKALMVLRTCIETLRDNQINASNRIVPYRDSKLTLLFKNYFDGEGKVKMIVCVSPSASDYDETIHVMRFAEVTQEVVVDRPKLQKADIGLAPGRKRAYMLYKAALSDATAASSQDSNSDGTGLAPLNPNAPHPYVLALGVISVQKYLSEECSSSTLAEFQLLLENRHDVRNQLIDDLKKKQVAFRAQLVAQEQELTELRGSVKELKHHVKSKDRMVSELQKLKEIITSQDEQIAQLHADVEQASTVSVSRGKEVDRLKQELSRTSEQRKYLMRTTEMYEADKRELESELSAEREELQKRRKETVKLRSTMQGFVSHEKQKFERLAQEMKSKEKDLLVKNETLKRVEALIKNSPVVRNKKPLQETNTTKNETGGRNVLPLRGKQQGGRKRSLSENWLEHKPSSTLNSGDILQPMIKKKKTVSTPQPKHLKSSQISKYCLQHQEEDSEGDIKTALYKGEVLRTRGGGTSVQFTDVEVLKHSRPKTPRERAAVRRSTRLATKRRPINVVTASTNSGSSSDSSLSSSCESSLGEQYTDVESRCAVAIEGRPGGAQPAHTHTPISRRT